MYFKEEQRKLRKKLWLILGIGIPAFLSIIWIILMGNGSGEQNESPVQATPTPAPLFPGALILLGTSSEGNLTIYELNGVDRTPHPLWSDIPGKIGWDDHIRDGYEKTVSSDSSLAVVPGSEGGMLIINLVTGEYTSITSGYQVDFVASFSPDNRYLAYGSRGDFDASLYLLDLSTNEVITQLYEAPCAQYERGSRACGRLNQPFWLDETTLIYSAYDGSLPGIIQVMLPGQTVGVEANTTYKAVIEQGQVVTNEVVSPRRIFDGIQNGSFLMSYDTWEAKYSWVDRQAFLAGRYESVQPFPDGSEWFGQIPYSISTDGRFVIFTKQGKSGFERHLIEVGSGVDLGTATDYYDTQSQSLDITWSPWMNSIAVRKAQDINIFLYTTGRSIRVEAGVEWPWQLLTWRP
jgi:WD40 repeat protein